ncbi:Crystal protein ET79 [Streptomyces sp. NPDC048550]|uniref:Crystal protein ET79 n=1 Tax=unclassified Streptomyces TaxID=2593676 RepID=UPI000AB562E7|nr:MULTISPECIES: Crystal protein ET79 [unclassified Streptomyces]MCX5148897.1 Crystal protein ET79 [Streptomyces sp. NBC_00320]WSN51953.1 Crystal protein ET79 [Streptomyces sp. NBC_01296]
MQLTRSAARWATAFTAVASLAAGATALAPAALAAPAAGPSPVAASSARSTDVVFSNSTSQQLTRVSSSLPHGCWNNDSLPPDYIAKGITASWGSRSCGMLTGTEGYTTYRVTATGEQIKIHWNNPYTGSNSYNCDVPSGYTCSRSGGGGDNATVSFTLTGGPAAFKAQAASTEVTAQAARSTVVRVINNSGTLLARTGAGLSHGIWTGNNLPPSLINPGAAATWESESEGVMTGTEGYANYTMAGGGTVSIRWDNPFSGSNKYQCNVPAPHRCTTSGGGGDNAFVTFAVN